MRKKVIFDSILSIISSAIPIVVLQLFILPVVANKLGNEQYGLAVTLISLATLFSLPLGNVLNNIRLLLDEKYKEHHIEGDFNLILLGSIIINMIVMVIGTIYYEPSFSIISIILVVLFSSLNLIREYLIVTFRIILNYKSILINNLFLGIGYLFGLLIFFIFEYWQLVYFFGALFSLIYITRYSNLLQESYRSTPFFKETLYETVVLFISVFLKSMLTYADKLLLFPLVGASAVSIYYSANLMGKIISMAITPISSVMLSYLAKMKLMKVKSFNLILLFTSVLGIIGYVVILFISKPILEILYPAWADESLKLIPITTATVIVGVISSVIHPIILRFNHINWQLWINLLNLLIYVVCAYIFYNYYGLIGFCVGMLIANVIKLLIMIFAFFQNRRPKKEKLV
ncbi:lipopolysaccharide biosynthesis protein [Tetragenococcus halophilus]|uniref:lipopolysaccharide biosynthesis protein n=1 Tax=Tetragenococcus halophilus TaxID=51669 RepID=UPI00209BA276|nr:oligosaccharide flippase family protein [Tetragenococcus halophilus]